MHARGAGRQRAEDRVVGRRRERLERGPREMAALEPADLAAERVGEQLGSEADAEDRHAAGRRLAQERRLVRQRGVERVLLAAQGDDAVDLAELRERVAVAQAPLVEPGTGAAQSGSGVAEERPLEVVDHGDHRRCHGGRG